MYKHALLLAALSAGYVAVASSSDSRVSPVGLAVSKALHLETFAEPLVKRQGFSDIPALQGLEGLIDGAMSGETCQSECNPWVEQLTGCVTNVEPTTTEEYNQIGQCACGDSPVAQMLTCGNCLGEAQAATDVQNLCSQAISGGTSLQPSSAMGSSAVGSRTASSVSTSASSAAQDLNTTDGDVEDVSQETATSSAPLNTASSSPSASSSPVSGASKVVTQGSGLFTMLGALTFILA